MSSLFNIENREPLNWISINSLEGLNSALMGSEKPKVFFKHSTRCGISVMALKSFEKTFANSNVDCELYYVDLLRYRDVSNKLEYITSVKHESPQVLVLLNDKILYSASHSSIDAKQLEIKIEQA